MCQLDRLFKIIPDQLFLVQRAGTRQSTNGIQHKLTKLYLLHQLFCLPLKSKSIILLSTESEIYTNLCSCHGPNKHSCLDFDPFKS